MRNTIQLGRACLNCNSTKLLILFIISKIGKPPGDPDHVIDYKHAVVVQCRACRAFQIERYDHDCFDIEDVFSQYEWYLLSPDCAEKFNHLLYDCSQPEDLLCDCQVHQFLRNAVEELPRSVWSSGLEHDAHAHLIRLVSDERQPNFSYIERLHETFNLKTKAETVEESFGSLIAPVDWPPMCR